MRKMWVKNARAIASRHTRWTQDCSLRFMQFFLSWDYTYIKNFVRLLRITIVEKMHTICQTYVLNFLSFNILFVRISLTFNGTRYCTDCKVTKSECQRWICLLKLKKKLKAHSLSTREKQQQRCANNRLSERSTHSYMLHCISTFFWMRSEFTSKKSLSFVKNFLWFAHSPLTAKKMVKCGTGAEQKHIDFFGRRNCTCKPQALNNVISGIIKCQVNLCAIHFFIPSLTSETLEWLLRNSSSHHGESSTRTLIKLPDWKIFLMLCR